MIDSVLNMITWDIIIIVSLATCQFYQLKPLALSAKKTWTFLGVGVIKVHLKQNRTQKESIKSFIMFSRCKIQNYGITIVGGI